MLLTRLLLTAVLVLAIEAKLTCLEWGLISPLVGIFCHFEPNSFEATKEKSTEVVKDAITSAKDLVEFDLTHNPVAVTYNFVEQSRQGGLGQGEAYLNNVTTDFRDVTVGFGKETANQVVQLYKLAHWNDLSLCLIRNAASKATQSSRRKTKRAQAISATDGVAIAKKCAMDKFRNLAKPAVFNVTGPGQKIGSTISDLAGMLVPVGLEGEATSAVTREAVDLAIPGSEESTRVYKLVDGKGEHFKSPQEARLTAAKMRDPAWVAEHCKTCRVPGPASIATSRMRLKRWQLSSTCCLPNIPAGMLDSFMSPEESEADLSTASPMDMADEVPFGDSDSTEDSEFLVSDVTLQTPVQHELRSIDRAEDIAKINADMETSSTSLMEWSPDLRNTMRSDQVFDFLRPIFENEAGHPDWADLLEISDERLLVSYDTTRVQRVINAYRWINSNNPRLQPLIRFVKKASEQCVDAVAKLQGLDVEGRNRLISNVKFHYDPPRMPSSTTFDSLLMSEETNKVRFVTSDTQGLVIENNLDNTYSALVPKPDSFYLLKGQKWMPDSYIYNLGHEPTRFEWFGQEAAQRGCVHISVTIS